MGRAESSVARHFDGKQQMWRHLGFARVKCKDCGHEYLLAYSCKRRHFCPSCHQKRVVEFGEWLCTEVLKYVPHRQWVFSIPKRLRIYFMFDRSLLTKLSRCAWKVLNLCLTQAVPYDDAKAGTAVAVQSFGDFQNFQPHLHVLATDGCFYNDAAFMVCPAPDTSALEKMFHYEVFKMLKAEGKITDVVIENMMNPHRPARMIT
jgi:ribosomal protein S27E